MLQALTTVKTIVVRLPNWVGDIVMATPVFETLRRNFPDATIAACVRAYARGIVQDGPWFDRVIECNDKGIRGLKRVVREVAELEPDMALLLPNTTHSYITARLSGIHQIYGYRRSFRKFFLTGGPEPLKEGGRYKPLPMQDYYMALCQYLGLEINEDVRCRLYLTSELKSRGEKLLSGYGIGPGDMVIGLNPGASFGSSKCWPAEYFARLAELLQGHWDCRLLLFAGPEEGSIADAILEAGSASIINTGPDRIDLAELKPLIQRCDLLVTNDTGPRHYAVAFDVPNVVLMGPTDPVYTAANLENTTVIRQDIPCSPCHKKVCPTDHRCMTGITPEMVFHEIKSLLKRE